MKKAFKQEIIHVIDVGNTSATYGLVRGQKISSVQSLNGSDIPGKVLKKDKRGFVFKNVVLLSSVVPKNTDKIISELYARSPHVRVFEIGKDIPVSFKHKYKNFKKLGIDRKINVYGAISSHKLPCLVFDYGTALTCDLIDEKGVFLGGLIIPGPATALRSLLDRTAQLPKAFKLGQESGLPYGRNTHDCIQHGVIQAYAAMTDGLIAKLSRTFKSRPHVVITGGFSSFIGSIISSKAQINPAHTLQSMLTLYQNWRD